MSALQPAVAYVRRSSGHQSCSIEQQLATIADFADRHDFEVIRTYRDTRSGVTLRGRQGLQDLLSAVQAGDPDFSAVLVYDISRWGRFQDIDEGAFYEFICLRAGVSVHYCAEEFSGDGSVAAGVVKSIKRAMAGEFSRQLSALVYAAQARASQDGYRQGGYAGYGFRRVAVDAQGNVVGRFEFGENKGLDYRTTLVLGPIEELAVIHQIYKMYVDEGLGMPRIAALLNKRGVVRDARRRPWTLKVIEQILTNEKYIGTHVYNRTSAAIRNNGKRTGNVEADWIRRENAFPAIVSRELFDRAQLQLKSRNTRVTAASALEHLRRILNRDGVLSAAAVRQDPDAPALRVYRTLFGGLHKAYELIDYHRLPQSSIKRHRQISRAQ